jgi:glycosyltransferase involved in cell wall biosynthesis
MIRFSLVLATVGRTDELERFLGSLDAQTYRDYELIVVDQNPDERLAPILASHVDKNPILRLRTESKGVSRARNLGLECASGDVIGFPDDDCRYPPDLLSTVARFFAEHPERDGLTGHSIDEDDKNDKISMRRFDAAPGPLNRINVWKRGMAPGIFLRRESVQGIWFDEELGPGAGTAWGAGEDTDYLLRLLDREASLYYDPNLVVIHPPGVPPYDTKAIRKTYAYSCGVGRVLKRHRMPLWFKAKWLIRPLGGALLSLAGLKPGEAAFRWNTFRGRLRGLLS